MTYQDLIKKGLLKKEPIGLDQVSKIIEKSYQNIKSAKILFKEGFEENGFQLTYQAMLLAGRALTFSYGLRPRAAGSHKIVIDFAERILGGQYKVLIRKFNKMRKKRNYLIYGIGLTVSGTEAKNGLKTAEDFIEKIKEHIQAKNPQKKLF